MTHIADILKQAEKLSRKDKIDFALTLLKVAKLSKDTQLSVFANDFSKKIV